MPTINFNNNGISPALKDKKLLKEFLTSIFKLEKVNFTRVSYIFCEDAFMLALNKEFLNHDTYTDIITFSLSAKNASIIAEIYISVERVKENALKFKIEYYNELLRVMIHGILHLCGYSDHTSPKKMEMRRMENFYLAKWFHVKRGH